MNLPINGRVAIVDDQISQAAPLMQVLSKKQIPFTYFSGDLIFLPEEGAASNDIRILFLDINLIDNTERDNRELKSKLVSVLFRIIGADNYPYAVIYWSRHERHKDLIESIFNNELSDRKPIAYISANKSDYFNLDGSTTDEFDTNITSLFSKVNDQIAQFPAYSHLLHWENQVHVSSDNVLQEVFSSYHEYEDWTNNANYIFEKLGLAYLGKHYEDSLVQDKIKASFMSLNSVFKDTLEQNIYSTAIPSADELAYNVEKVVNSLAFINEKLNISRIKNNISESGNVVLLENDTNNSYDTLLHKILSRHKLREQMIIDLSMKSEQEIEKLIKTNLSSIKSEIKATWQKIAVVVTPICDYIQKNNRIYDRVIKGIMIKSKFVDIIDNKSEAVYTLPITISNQGENYILVLDFRHFITTELSEDEYSVIFRLRQELLAEIQSRLARHINRQGILFLSDK